MRVRELFFGRARRAQGALVVLLCASGCSYGVIETPEDEPVLSDPGTAGAPDAATVGPGSGFDGGGAPSTAADASAGPGWPPATNDAGGDLGGGPGDPGTGATNDGGGTAGAGAMPDAGGMPDPDNPGPDPSSDPESGRLAGVTAAHNAVRAAVSTSPPLPPLTWSAEIAEVAQRYAEKLAASCSGSLMHSTPQERNGWGENLAAGGGFGQSSLSPQQAVGLWESERACYQFGPFQPGTNATCSSECARYGGCGHYTQIVWRNTQRLGCGVADCTQGSTRRTYWVCNYDPPGNYLGQLPY